MRKNIWAALLISACTQIGAYAQNFDDFFTTYDVKEGDGMWRSPEERVIIW